MKMAIFLVSEKKGVFETEWLTRYEQVQKSVKSRDYEAS